uniref:UPF0235 protein Cyan7425_4156 n=1 Tax=Cyanothece sp. (strain PCC 7425 / ATCC 29141) TaxID=395961 RepID=B8HWP3_CYAP4
MAKLKVKVVPSSSRDLVVGWLGEALKVKVKAPPEKGKANAAVIALLATHLGIDQTCIEVLSGHTSAAKVLSIEGLDQTQIRAALSDVSG